MENPKIELSDSQHDFVYSDKNQALFCGGIGSGKTFSGAVWAICMALEFPEVQGLITANTHSQLQKATLSELFKVCKFLGIPYTYKINQNLVTIGDAKILCYSLEKHDNVRGVNVGWWWGDECAFYKKLAFDAAMGRLRDKNGPCHFRGTTTPNGFNWLYEYFVENPEDYKEVVYSSSKDNQVNLSDEYVKQLESQYDAKMAQQELDGHFVNLNSGLVYHAFDRRKHINKAVEWGPNDKLYIGLDFNVNPLCAVLVAKRGDMLYIYDEIYLTNSNTFEMAKEILKTIPHRNVEIIADETGNRRKTSSNMTDHEILRRAGLDVVKFRNPAVRDRHNNVNRLLERNYVKFNPRCKMTVKDLEQVAHEKNDDNLTHISDALGYVLWYLNPLEKPRRKARISYY